MSTGEFLKVAILLRLAFWIKLRSAKQQNDGGRVAFASYGDVLQMLSDHPFTMAMVFGLPPSMVGPLQVGGLIACWQNVERFVGTYLLTRKCPRGLRILSFSRW